MTPRERETRRVAAVLRSHGVDPSPALVDALAVLSEPVLLSDGRPAWRLGQPHPQGRDRRA